MRTLSTLTLKGFTTYWLCLTFTLLSIAPSVNAQTYYTVGTGTTVNGTTTASPVNIYYRRHVTQFVLTKAELNAQGLSCGLITELGFDVTSSPIYNIPGYTIKLKHVSEANVATALGTTGWSEVKFISSYAPDTAGFDMHEFDNDFYWNGSDNLGVEICWAQVSPTWNSSGQCRVFSSTSGFRYTRTDGAGTSCGETPSFTLSTKPITRIGVTPAGLDAGVSLVSPSPTSCSLTSASVMANVANGGGVTITSFTLNWSINGTLQTPVSFTGDSIATCSDSTITLGTASFNALDTLDIWVTSVNGITGQDSIPGNDLSSTVFTPALFGVFTIGGTTPDYATIQDAADDLASTGICGPVTMHIRDGVYNEQVTLGAIPGSSMTNTVTFTQDPTNTTGVEVTNNFDYTWKLNGCSWVTLDSIEISTTGFANVVEMAGFTEHNTIQNCVLNGESTSTSTSNQYAVIYESTSSTDYSHYLTIQNNEINDGSYSAYIYGNFSNRDENVIFSNNHCEGFYIYGCYIPYTDTADIEWNYFESRDNGYGFGGGAVYSFTASQFDVNYNEVIMKSSGYAYGIYLSSVDGSSTARSEMIGNSVTIVNASTNTRAVYLSGSDYYDFYYNSVRDNGSSTSTFYAAVYMTGAGMDVQNNIITNMSGGYGWYNSNSGTTHNNNLFYSEGGTATSETLGTSEFIAWPAFTADTNLMISSWTPAYNGGTPIAGVTMDLAMVTRNVTTPDIGAYEFDLPPNDAGITSLDNPVPPVSAGADTIKVSIRNFGGDSLTSATINWIFNGTAQTAVSWTGALAPGQEANDVVLGVVTIPTGFTSLVAYTTLPNGLADGNTSNDTLVVDLCTPLSGVFTLGGSTADFANFTEMTDALSNCGIGGPITVNVVSGTGPFDEQVVFTNYPGISATNTLTINGNGETLQREVATSDYRILGFDGAKHITIDSLRLTTTSIYGWGVHFMNESDSNTIKNCIIDLSGIGTTSSAASAGIIASGSTTSTFTDGDNANYCVFENNTIMGGATGSPYYGIYLNGQLTGADCMNNQIIDNTIQDHYSFGIYLDEAQNTQITGNSITRPTRTQSTTQYGLYMTGKSQNSYVEGNYIGELLEGVASTTSTVYHIYVGFADADSSQENVFVNNIIGNTTSNGDQYGFYNSSSDGMILLHNTVAQFKGTSTGTFYETYGFYQTSTASNIKLFNNIFYGDRSGSGENYGLYFNATGSTIESDYNNIWVDTTISVNAVGYRSGAHQTLGDWQAVNSGAYDQNSWFANPYFLNPNSGDFTPSDTTINNNGLSGLTGTDFYGVSRSVTPDPGAIEFDVLPVNMVALQSVTGSLCGPGVDTAYVDVKQTGSTPITSLPILVSVNGGTYTTALTYTGTITPQVVVTIPVPVTYTTAGINTVSFAVSATGESAPENDTTMTTTNVRELVSTFPYMEGFESGAAGWSVEGANTTWELGTPSNTIINGASEGTQAWATNLDGQYSAGEFGSVTSPCFDFSTFNNTVVLEMETWWNSEFSWDGMNVEYSDDNGASWNLVGSQGTGYNWYTDGSINGLVAPSTSQQGWTGRNASGNGSDGWVTAKNNISTTASAVIFRVNFGSDGSVQDEGTAFDLFRLWEAKPYDAQGFSARAEYFSYPEGQTGAVGAKAEIFNAGLNTISSVGVTAMYGTQTTLGTGDSLQINTVGTVYTPGGLNIPSGGPYTFDAYATITETDSNAFNDTVSGINVNVTDSVYARDNDDQIGGIGSNSGILEIGQIFTVTTADTITAFNVNLDGNSGDSVRIKVYNMSGGLPDSVIFESDPKVLTGISSWYSFALCDNPVVDTGDYFVAAEQMNPTSNMGLGYATDNFTPNSIFYGVEGGTWTAVENAGFPYPMMLRVVMGHPVDYQPITASAPAFCAGDSVMVMAADYSAFNWSTGETTQSISVNAEGWYNVTVTRANGCEIEDSIYIEDDTISVSITGTTPASCGAASGTITGTGAGAYGSVSYMWSSGDSTATAVNLTSGTYTVTVTDSLGCSAEVSDVVVDAGAPTITFTTTDVVCGGDSTGQVVANVVGGITPYEYVWSNGDTTATISGLPAGVYDLTVTDAVDCSALASDTVDENPILLVDTTALSNVSCFGLSDGSITVASSGGVGTTSYMWSNGATTATASTLAATTYTVTVTDSVSCTRVASYAVSEPTVLSSSITAQTNVSCNAGSNGSLTVTATGGTVAYAYLWSNAATGATASGLAATTYTVTVTDDNGCTSTSSATITEPSVLSTTLGTITNVLCNGASTGSIATSTSGGTAPYAYSWSGGGTTSTKTAAMAGTYTLTVTDDLGCTSTVSGTITEPTAIASSLDSIVTPLCNGDTNASIFITTSGGTGTLSFDWSSGQTTEDITTLVAGTYTVSITDANNCEVPFTYVVTEPAVLMYSIDNVVNSLCELGSNGQIQVTTSGGTSPYSFAWSDSSSNEDATGLAYGSYTMTVTDENGCTYVDGDSVGFDNAAPFVEITGDDTVCYGETAFMNATTGLWTYNWSTGSVFPVAFTDTSGTYFLTVATQIGCENYAEFTVLVGDSISLSVSGTDVNCEGGNDGSATATAGGGNGTITYMWSDNQTTATASNLMAGNYMVTITDGFGCTETDEVDIDFTNTNPVIDLGNDTIICYVPDFGFNSITLTPGAGFASYMWSNAATTDSIMTDGPGVYSVVVVDGNGCSATDSITVDTTICVGVNELTAGTISLYPNPTRGMLTVELSGMNSRNMELTIMSITGTTVYSNVHGLTGGSLIDQIDLSGYAKGIYIVDVLVDGKHHTSRITLQ